MVSDCGMFFSKQNPEPSVEFDTVANVKKQHEVNVGMKPTPSNSLIIYIFQLPNTNILTELLYCLQPYRTHLDLVDITLSLPFLHSSPDHPSLCSSFVLHQMLLRGDLKLFLRQSFILLLLRPLVVL